MTDLFTTRVGDQIKFLEGAFVAYGRKLTVQEVAAQVPWLFTMPILGPVFSWLLGRVVNFVLAKLAKNAEFKAFFVNTRRRADAQADRFEALVKARSEAQSPEDLNRAEAQALKAFDGLVKYSE